jgi:Uma2 family endonuclease
MTVSLPSSAPNHRARRSYVRPPAPLHFPTEEQVPESIVHRKRVNLLYAIVEHAFHGRALVSCDQFLYWDATDPKRRLAPDVAMRRGVYENERLDSWKTWLLGAPEVGVEIVSEYDRSEGVFDLKLERYRQAGILEVVRFDPEDREQPLRLWDLFDGDLVERELGNREALYCDALGLYWCVEGDSELGRVLRLGHDQGCKSLLPTPEEAERAAKEAERAAKEAERKAKESALFERDQALARIRELEAELAKRRT